MGLSYADHVGRNVLWAVWYGASAAAAVAVAFPEFAASQSGIDIPVLEPTSARPAVLLALVCVWLLGPFFGGNTGAAFDLHGYQKEYLGRLAEANGLRGGDAEARVLRTLVENAMGSAGVREAIFGTFQCVHCGSKNPPDWVKNGMGKESHPLAVGNAAVSFLSQEILLPVGPPGPNKKVQEGPKRSDQHKAARTVIDWSIKEFGDSPSNGCMDLAALKAKHDK